MKVSLFQKTALTQKDEVVKDESRKEELEQIKQSKDTKQMKKVRITSGESIFWRGWLYPV